jgi:hypothetical protein
MHLTEREFKNTKVTVRPDPPIPLAQHADIGVQALVF